MAPDWLLDIIAGVCSAFAFVGMCDRVFMPGRSAKQGRVWR